MKGLRYQKVTYKQMYRKWPVYIGNALPKNLDDAPFSFLFGITVFAQFAQYIQVLDTVKIIQSVLNLLQ